jgi:hypothetical protein
MGRTIRFESQTMFSSFAASPRILKKLHPLVDTNLMALSMMPLSVYRG